MFCFGSARCIIGANTQLVGGQNGLGYTIRPKYDCCCVCNTYTRHIASCVFLSQRYLQSCPQPSLSKYHKQCEWVCSLHYVLSRFAGVLWKLVVRFKHDERHYRQTGGVGCANGTGFLGKPILPTGAWNIAPAALEPLESWHSESCQTLRFSVVLGFGKIPLLW